MYKQFLKIYYVTSDNDDSSSNNPTFSEMGIGDKNSHPIVRILLQH